MQDRNDLAPIAVIAFNRADTLKTTLTSLAANPLADQSDLYIFIDGPRSNKGGEDKKINKVKAVANGVTGFKSVTIKASEQNKGLARNIIDSTTELLNKYGRIIVVEDDLYLSPSFLTYMNTMLTAYQDDERIMQVTGYSIKIRNHEQYSRDYYMSHRAHSWGWGTWKDRWETVDWEVRDFNELATSKKKRRAFCEYGSDMYGMLEGWKTGKNNSWFVRFNYSMHKQGKFSVAPIQSLVRNDGFGSEATHCTTYNRYKIDFMIDYKNDWNVSKPLVWDKRLDKESVRYWNILYRIYGKIMSIIYK